MRVSRKAQHTNTDTRHRAQCLTPFSEACQQARLRYFGHLCRLPLDRDPNIALLRDAPSDRRQARPATSWLDLIHLDAATRGLTRADLHRLAPDRDVYRRVVYADRDERSPPPPPIREPVE